MLRHLRLIEARVLPRGWKDLIRQIVLFIGAFLVYDLVRSLADPRPGQYKPFGDAMKIIDLERTLHIFIEPSVQAWAMNMHWLMDGLDWIYLNGHLFVTLAVLAFIYLRRNTSFYFVRNTVMIAMGLALIGYALYPTAPPRLMPEWGFTDSISQFVTGGTGWVDNGPTKAFINFYAAVPSMHVCFATIVGVSMYHLTPPPDREDRVGSVSGPGDLRGRRHGQSLFDRCLPRSPDRRDRRLLSKRLLARARPEAWAFSHVPA